MEVAFLGVGKVAERCFDVLKDLPVTIIPQVMKANADLWVSVHWPKIFTAREIALPKLGIVNLHNAYLPWNRGAHACTWAIVDKTPHGATMHWIDAGVDTGPILLQRRVDVQDTDTADTLYKRTADVEVEIFKIGMDMILTGNRRRLPQPSGGSFHYKRDFDRLVRAMTTSDCKVIREV